MNRTIKLSDNQAEALLETLILANDDISRQILELQSRFDENLKIIQELSGTVGSYNQTLTKNSSVQNNSKNYNSSWPLPAKAEFIITELGKSCTVRYIADQMYLLEPELKEEKEDRDVITQLAASLASYVKKDKRFGRYKPKRGGQYKYGLSNWFYTNGTIKTEYE